MLPFWVRARPMAHKPAIVDLQIREDTLVKES
jgi:hypothetical protein